MGRPLPWLLSALLSATSSAAVLATVFVLLQLHGRWPNSFKSHQWRADAFTVIQGNGAVAHDLMHLQSAPGQQAVAVVDHVDLHARAYPYVRLAIDQWPPGTEVSLLWVTQAEAGKVHWIPLRWKTRFVRLAGNPNWRGKVTTIGLAINNGSSPAKLTWHSVSAQPATPFGLLHAVIVQWTTFEPWSLHSSNYIVGGQRHALVPPVVAVAAWVAVAMLLYLVFALVRCIRPDAKVVGTLVLVGWITLDAGWQFNLIRQLGVSRSQYAGKSQSEKHLVGIGGGVFRFVQQIKQSLPAKTVRVFVLVSHPDAGNKFYRLRALYDLLPENVYAFSQYPPSPRLLHAGDYLVTLGQIPGLSVNAASGLMRWDGQQIRVRQVLMAERGSLYEVR